MEHLTQETFISKIFNYEVNKEWKYEGELPCLIDFYADWCGPCKMVSPILEELSEVYKGRVEFYKVDTDQQHELSAVFGIKSIPSLFLCPKTGEPSMYVGAFPKEQLIEFIEKTLLT